MTDKEIQKIADLLFEKFLKREQEYLAKEEELPLWWVATDTTGTWYTFNSSEGFKPNKELFVQRLVALNIQKQELIEQENYEELIKLQEKIDEVKEQLKKYKD